MNGTVFNIQRFTIHDGPGVRTEVFLKGCPLSCKWCSNPEGIDPKREVGVYPSKCLGKDACGSCLEVCSLGGAPLLFGAQSGKIGSIDRSICIGCMKCTQECFMHALKSWGMPMSVEDVMAEVEADISLYQKSGGGITISGGEATVQWEFTLALLDACRASGIHTCLETCLQCQPQTLQQLLPSCDMVIADIKSMDTAVHERWCGVGNEFILANAKLVAESSTPMIIRVPMVPEVNDDEANIRATAEFVSQELGKSVIQVQLLPYLRMGEEKYASLGIGYPMGEDFSPESAAERQPHIDEMAKVMRGYGIDARSSASEGFDDAQAIMDNQ